VPYFKVGDRLFTPNEAIEELDDTPKIMGGKKITKVADGLADQLDPETPTPLVPDNPETLVVEQFRKRVEAMDENLRTTPVFGIMNSDVAFSLQDILDEIDKDSVVGKDYKTAMVNYYHRLIKKARGKWVKYYLQE